MSLTDAACRNAKPKDKPYKLADGFGLYLEVLTTGGRSWRWKYRFAGKEKRLIFGKYPDVSLADAREKREAGRKLLAQGIDPGAQKQDAKRQARLNAENTFEAIAREWHAQQCEIWSPRYADEVLNRFDRDIFPAIGKLPIADIKALALLDAIRKIERRGAKEIARRALQTCGQVLRYAVATGRAERDPSADLKGALKPFKHTHFAALDVKDLPEFLMALDQNRARLYRGTQLAIRLLMLTFVRTSELIQATWDEFDLANAEWAIPAARMKMRKPHIVPLSHQALAVLHELKQLSGDRPYVFPNQVRPRKAMSNNTILHALKRMGYKGRATGHGFRALAMSAIKEKLGYRHEVVDRQLAHAPKNKVDAAYDRATFLDDRKRMMQEWADYIDNAAKTKPTPATMLKLVVAA